MPSVQLFIWKMQQKYYRDLYNSSKELKKGTIFEDIDKSFERCIILVEIFKEKRHFYEGTKLYRDS